MTQYHYNYNNDYNMIQPSLTEKSQGPLNESKSNPLWGKTIKKSGAQQDMSCSFELNTAMA